MEHQQQTNNGSNNNNNINTIIDSDKCQKVKRFIIIGLLVTIGILGYHFYEYFHGKPLPKAPQDMLSLSKELYSEEMAQSPYLFKVNLQGKTRAGAHDDKAPEPLFVLHNDLLATDSNSTTTLMRRLFNNYELDVSVPDHVTPEHEEEQHEFLRAVLNTRQMKLSMRYLVSKDIVKDDYDAQMQLLKELWFTPYSRGNNIIGSSSFEHVFMAEIRDQRVLGLHNWIYFAEQEQLGHVDYKGWLKRVDLGRPQQFILAFRSTFHNLPKGYNSFLVGTSPELELSLYTVCFLTTAEKEPCAVQLGPAKLFIVTHVWNWKGKRLIASAYTDIQD
ncbi:poly(U)-specific endoribonuclease homolog [Scaptodrosophila lebanonensis]|uniref:Poly(U)-specific endoribonuclease homolog n=1 Tax=Drosophila lebanonensis TaxID=7225 RepID=A0A6J2TEX6_DROLE|nr:poly(U)-specific endoribonuclease homolog [Scaptodrosophila lebanonensis]